MVVLDRNTRQQRFLTAAHVVGWLNPHRGDTNRVHTNDLGGTTLGSRYIGYSDRSCPDEAPEDAPAICCGVDAALVHPATDVTCVRDIGNGICATGDYYDNPLDPALYELTVYKLGATSGFTSGVICEVGVQFTVDHGALRITYPLGYHVMSNVDQATFALPGDSGAIVLDGRGRAVGMLVAMQRTKGDPSALAFVIPMAALVQELIGPGWH